MSETEKMAPKVSMETVMVVRPFKVGAAVLGFVAMIVSAMFIGVSAWVTEGDYRMGLWEECMEISPGRVNCTKYDPQVFIVACRGLTLLGLIMTFLASVTVCHGINAGKFSTRYRCYFVAMLIYFLGVMFNVTGLIIFPLKYSEQSGQRAGDTWSVGWAYIIGWLVCALQITCALLLCLDKDADEVLVREKTDYDNGIEEERLTESETDCSETESDIAYADDILK